MPEELVRKTFDTPDAITLDGGGALYRNGGGYTYPLSVGPDGTILWFGVMPVDHDMVYYSYFGFVQRDHELLVVSVNESRGAGDEKGYLSDYVSDLISNGRFGSFEWSPDGHYIFLNNASYWQGNGMVTLPYIMDTHTGEVFLIYSRPDLDQYAPALRYPPGTKGLDDTKTCCTCWDGHFSRDGKYLYLILYGNLPDWETRKVMMRWNLQSETMEECCRLNDDAGIFVELAEDRWLVSCSGSSWQTVTADGTGFTVASDLQLPSMAGGVQFYGGLSRSGVLIRHSIYGPFSFISMFRDPSNQIQTSWLLSYSEDGLFFLREMNPDEVSPSFFARMLESEQEYPRMAKINAVFPVLNTPYVLIRTDRSITETELWTPVKKSEIVILFLNTETMELKPIRFTGAIRSFVGHEAAASGEVFAGNQTAYRILPNATADSSPVERDKQWIKSWNRVVEPGIILQSGNYTYSVQAVESDRVLLRNGDYDPDGFRVENDIEVLDDCFRITGELSAGNEEKTSIPYSIHASAADLLWSQRVTFALCELSDRLASLVYRGYTAADPKPGSVESLALSGQYIYEYIPYQVTLDSVQEEANRLTLVFTAVPEDEWGMFPKQ